jgi:hypothetical protein
MYDERKVEEVVLALLHLNAFKDGYGWRAWKGFDWDALDRLHERGLIGDPKSRARSVPLTDEGAAMAEELFHHHFGLRATADEREERSRPVDLACHDEAARAVARGGEVAGAIRNPR